MDKKFRPEVVRLAIRCLNGEVSDVQLEYLLVTQEISREELARTMEHIVDRVNHRAARRLIFFMVLGAVVGFVLPKLLKWLLS